MEGITISDVRVSGITDSFGNRVSYAEFERYGKPAIRLLPQLVGSMSSPQIVAFVKKLIAQVK